MQFKTLPAWLAWLEQCHPNEIDLGLERIKRVAKHLDLLQPSASVITVAGTNGKGSCVTATAALLKAAGYSVGVYTSPHLIKYNERIVVNGHAVSDEEICAAFDTIYNAAQQTTVANPAPISLTYFEYGTLAALEIFRRRQVTAIVLEVGLGGRLDAVNIIDADIAVITSIDIDHQDWLGDNREVIGHEKAGILREARPAICADANPPQSILDYAHHIKAQLSLINTDFGYHIRQGTWSWWSGAQVFNEQPLPQLPLPSLAAALQVAITLDIDLVAINAFVLLAGLRVPGRFQKLIWKDRTVILDVAHNPAATAYLAGRLQQSSLLSQQTHAIVAMMADKDRNNSLRNLMSVIDHWYLADLPAIPRAAQIEQLRQNLVDLGLAEDFAGSVEQCLAHALANSASGDRIIIVGSFYTVAAGLNALAIGDSL